MWVKFFDWNVNEGRNDWGGVIARVTNEARSGRICTLQEVTPSLRQELRTYLSESEYQMLEAKRGNGDTASCPDGHGNLIIVPKGRGIEITDYDKFLFHSSNEAWYPGLIQMVVLRQGRERELMAVNIHGLTVQGEDTKTETVEREEFFGHLRNHLREWRRRWPRAGVIAGGDYNTVSDQELNESQTRLMREFAMIDLLGDVPCMRTSHTEKRAEKNGWVFQPEADHILVAGVEVGYVEVLRDESSDHYPVRFEVGVR